jgi:hypothetical protein
MDATEADIIELQKNLGARLRKMQRMMTRD